MSIGCLGWGSLIWNPGELPKRGPWFTDGPFLPIEFARQSKDGRITLVLVRGRALVRSLWTVLALTELDEAVEALQKREGIAKVDIDKHIGRWTKGRQAADDEIDDEIVERIEKWGEFLNLDAVIWTNLPPKFKCVSDDVPNAEQVVWYLDHLEGAKRRNAEHYVRMAPRQIDTDYRRSIEADLGWTPYPGCVL